MNGKAYEILTTYNELISSQLNAVREGRFEGGKDTTEVLSELATSLETAVPDIIKYMEKLLSEDSTTVHKLHIGIEGCERFLKDLDFIKRVTHIDEKDEENNDES